MKIKSYVIFGIVFVVFISVMVTLFINKESYAKLWAQPNLIKSNYLAARVTPNAQYDTLNPKPHDVVLVNNDNIVYGDSYSMGDAPDIQ